jgi:hypothetical protein
MKIFAGPNAQSIKESGAVLMESRLRDYHKFKKPFYYFSFLVGWSELVVVSVYRNMCSLGWWSGSSGRGPIYQA